MTMRAMKDSGIEWIGEIPQNWHTTRIKYCTAIDQEKLSEKTDPEYTFQYIDISGVTEYGGIGETTEMTFEKSPSRARMVVKPGDTIISTVRTYLKAVAYIDSLEDHICSTGFCVLSPKNDLFPKFAYYVLQSDYVVQKIVSESVGVSYPAISSTEIGDIKIALPEYIAQARIAGYLDTKCAEIDALIAAKEKTNALLKERRQSIIYEAVTKGLDPTVPMKDSGVEWIGEIPEGWSTRKAKYIGLFKSGDGITAENISEQAEYPVYGGNGIRGYTNEYTHEGTYVLIGRQGALCGNVHLVSGSFWASEHAVVGEIIPGYEARLAYYVLTSFNLNRLSVTAAQPGISVDQIENVIVPMPSCMEEQKSICDFLDNACRDADSVIAFNEETIQKLKDYRQSLIYEAVTGKIDI